MQARVAKVKICGVARGSNKLEQVACAAGTSEAARERGQGCVLGGE